LLGAFFSLLFLLANKVSKTVCNVSNFVLTPSLHKCGFCHFYARKGLTQLIWREWAMSGIPDDVIFIDSLLSLGGRPDFHFDSAPATKCLLLKQKVQRLTCLKSDLSHEQVLGEVCGEVDDGPLQPYQTLDFGDKRIMFYVGYLWISYMDIH
jgi:hypothetical protein